MDQKILEELNRSSDSVEMFARFERMRLCPFFMIYGECDAERIANRNKCVHGYHDHPTIEARLDRNDHLEAIDLCKYFRHKVLSDDFAHMSPQTLQLWKAQIYRYLAKLLESYDDPGCKVRCCDCYEKSIKEYYNPNIVISFVNYLHTQFKDDHRKQQQASQLLTTVSERLPGNSMGHYNLGVYYMDAKKYNAASKEFKKAIDLDDTNVLAYCDQASLFVQQGPERYADARISCQKTLELVERKDNELSDGM